MLLQERRKAPRHRKEGRAAQALAYVAAGVRAGFAKLVEHDLPLMTATALLVLGGMCSLLAAIGWYALSNTTLTWLMASAGMLSWLFGLGIFVIFPPVASPRHSKGS